MNIVSIFQLQKNIFIEDFMSSPVIRISFTGLRFDQTVILLLSNFILLKDIKILLDILYSSHLTIQIYKHLLHFFYESE